MLILLRNIFFQVVGPVFFGPGVDAVFLHRDSIRCSVQALQWISGNFSLLVIVLC